MDKETDGVNVILKGWVNGGLIAGVCSVITVLIVSYIILVQDLSLANEPNLTWVNEFVQAIIVVAGVVGTGTLSGIGLWFGKRLLVVLAAILFATTFVAWGWAVIPVVIALLLIASITKGLRLSKYLG